MSGDWRVESGERGVDCGEWSGVESGDYFGYCSGEWTG